MINKVFHTDIQKTYPHILINLSWLPIAVFLTAILILQKWGVHTNYESVWLITTINGVSFICFSVLTAWFAGYGYLASNSFATLMLGCGILTFGISCVIGAVYLSFFNNYNAAVTIHNIGAGLSGLFHLAGAFYLMLRDRFKPKLPKKTVLAAFYAFVTAAMGILTFMAQANWLPEFISGKEPTSIRTIVLTVTVFEYFLAALLLAYISRGIVFMRFYWMGLLLTGMGLTSIGLDHAGSLLNWTGRIAQSFGQLYILISPILLLRFSYSVGERAGQNIGFSFRQLDIELMENEKRYRFLFENIYEGVAYCKMLYDKQTNKIDFMYLEVNRPFEKLTGLKNIAGKRFSDTAVALGTATATLTKTCEQVAFTGKSEKMELEIKPISKWFSVSVHCPAKDTVVFTFYDITHRKKSEELLKENERHLAHALEAGNFGSWDLDTVTGKVWRSLKHDQIFGYESLLPQWTTQTFFDHVLPEYRTEIENKYKQALAEGTDLSFECPIRRTDGELRWIWAHGKPWLDKKNKVIRMTGLVMDITEKKKEEEQILWLASFPERNPNPVLEIEPSGKPYYLNPTTKRLMPDLELLGSKHPFLENIKSIYQDLKESGKENFSRDIKTGNIWFHQTFNYNKISDTIRIYALEITKRKTAELLIKKNLLRFELLTQTAGELLRFSKPEKLVDSLCRKVMECLDCQVFFNYLADDKTGCLRLNAYAGIADEDARKIERLNYGEDVCGYAARDGYRIVANNIDSTPNPQTDLVKSYGIKAYACHPLFGADSKTIGTLSFGTKNRDVINDDDLLFMKLIADQISMAMIRMRAEETLRAHQAEIARIQDVKVERERLYAVLDTLPAYVVLLTPDHHISFANRFFRQRFGEDHGRPCYQYLFNLEEPCDNCETYKVLKTGEKHHWEWTGPDGRDYDIYDFPFKEIDGSIHVMEMGIDITDRKNAEKDLIKAQIEIEQAKRLSDIGTLAATIAHELRNPLAAIKLAASNIERKANNPLLDKHLKTIDKKVHESDLIINNLLFYSRLRNPNHENININHIIEECAELFQKQPKFKKDVAFVKNTGSTKDIFIDADRVQITEILHNILNNSYDAVPESGGLIEICTKLDDENLLKISIRDNGTGIDKEYIDKIFDPFFTTKARGTGLGLSVCKQLVTLHGGTIYVESEPDKGSIIHICLPVKNMQAVTASEQYPASKTESA